MANSKDNSIGRPLGNSIGNSIGWPLANAIDNAISYAMGNATVAESQDCSIIRRCDLKKKARWRALRAAPWIY